LAGIQGKLGSVGSPPPLLPAYKKSMGLLGAKVGLEITSICYDSFDFQFWGSEESRKGIPRYAEHSYTLNPEGSIFSETDIKDFRKRAEHSTRNRPEIRPVTISLSADTSQQNLSKKLQMQGTRIFRNEAYFPVRRNDLPC